MKQLTVKECLDLLLNQSSYCSETWVSFSFNTQTNQAVTGGFGRTKQIAEDLASKRFPGFPCIVLQMLVNPFQFREKLFWWLAEQGVVGVENAQMMESLMLNLRKIFTGIDPRQVIDQGGLIEGCNIAVTQQQAKREIR